MTTGVVTGPFWSALTGFGFLVENTVQDLNPVVTRIIVGIWIVVGGVIVVEIYVVLIVILVVLERFEAAVDHQSADGSALQRMPQMWHPLI